MKQLMAVLMVVVLGCVFAGCGEKSAADKGQDALKQVKVPETADATVKEFAAALKNGELIKIYAMLPDSYQKDVQAIVAKVGEKMDKEVYEKAFGLLPKALEVAKTAKDKMPVPPEAVGLAEELLKIVTAAKLNTLDGLKGLNAAGFLAEHGKALCDLVWKGASMDGKNPEELKKALDGIKVEVKGTKDNEATLLVTFMDKPEEMVFVKVENKWIPKELADGWAKGKDEALKGIEAGLGELAKNKAQILEMLKGVEDALAKNDPSAIMGLVMMGAMGGHKEEAPVEEAAPAPAPAPAEGAAPAPAPAQ